MLNTPLAASLLFSLRRHGGRLGLPEVVEQELRKNAANTAVDAAQKLNDAAALLADMGIHTGLAEPHDTESVRARSADRMLQLEPFLHRVPLSLVHAQRALERVNAELPPNGPGNQQFKDSLIWEAVLELSSEYAVTFLTGDKGFFEGRDFRKGIARALAGEAGPTGVSVVPPPEIRNLLEQLSSGLTAVQREDLRSAVRATLVARLETAARALKFTVGELLEQNEWAFVTENAGVLSVQFQLHYEAFVQPSGSHAITVHFDIAGSCLYSVDERHIDDVLISHQSVSLDEQARTMVTNNLHPLVNNEGWIGPQIALD